MQELVLNLFEGGVLCSCGRWKENTDHGVEFYIRPPGTAA